MPGMYPLLYAWHVSLLAADCSVPPSLPFVDAKSDVGPRSLRPVWSAAGRELSAFHPTSGPWSSSRPQHASPNIYRIAAFSTIPSGYSSTRMETVPVRLLYFQM